MEKVIKRLTEKIDSEYIIENADMSQEVSFKAGGRADLLVEPQSIEQLQHLLQVLDEENVNHIIMGNGSNFLIKDGGYRGVVVKMISENFAYTQLMEDGLTVKVGAATLLSQMARFLLGNELTGFEFASGIPGSIGGAVFMNAGAYGGEMKDCIVSAKAVSKDGREVKELSLDDLKLSYRKSALYETGDVVVEATFKFEKGDKKAISERMKELNQQRNSKQPVNYPSAGSFFKRPEGYFAGKLVQDAGLKGYTVGGAQVSELHSGFVINKGGATATDIVNLMHHCQAEVERQFGVKLEPEVRILGED